MTDVALSEAVPHVPSTSVRRTVPADVSLEVDRWATTHQLGSDEGLELLLRSRLSSAIDSPAATLSAAYESNKVQSVSDIEAALAAAEVGDPVVGIRLGPKRLVSDTDPFPRDHVGADLADTPTEIWPAVRGLWRIQGRWRYVVAFRLGMPLALYRIADWEHYPPTNRRWAKGGVIIDGQNRLDVTTAASVEPCSRVDLAVHRSVFAAPLAMTGGAANPLVLLNSR